MKASALDVVQNINALDSRLILCFARRRTAFGRFYALKSPEKRRGKLRVSPSGRAFISCFSPDFSPGILAKTSIYKIFQLVSLVAFFRIISKKIEYVGPRSLVPWGLHLFIVLCILHDPYDDLKNQNTDSEPGRRFDG